MREHSHRGYCMMGEGSTREAVGDRDGDGVPDYLIAANEDGLDRDPGLFSVVSGATGKALQSRVFESQDGVCGPGVDACAIGDVDGDGVTDLAQHVPRLRQAQLVSGEFMARALRTIDLRAPPWTDEPAQPAPSGERR